MELGRKRHHRGDGVGQVNSRLPAVPGFSVISVYSVVESFCVWCRSKAATIGFCDLHHDRVGRFA
jgi:hypothetical protein